MAINKNGIVEIFTKLEDKVSTSLDSFMDYHDISGPDKAAVLAETMKTLITVSVQGVQTQELNDEKFKVWAKDVTLKAAQEAEYKAVTIRKDEIHTKQKDKLTIENFVLENTKSFKIQQAQYATLKINNEALLIGEEKTQLIASVGYNNKIKMAQVLGSTFGTGLAGGVVVPTNGWTVLMSIANDLTGYSQTITDSDFTLLENV